MLPYPHWSLLIVLSSHWTVSAVCSPRGPKLLQHWETWHGMGQRHMVRGQAMRREASKGWTLAAKATGHHQGVCQPAWAECWISARFQTGNKTAEPFICVSLSSHIKDQSGDGFSFCCHLEDDVCTHSWLSTSICRKFPRKVWTNGQYLLPDFLRSRENFLLSCPELTSAESENIREIFCRFVRQNWPRVKTQASKNGNRKREK